MLLLPCSTSTSISSSYFHLLLLLQPPTPTSISCFYFHLMLILPSKVPTSISSSYFHHLLLLLSPAPTSNSFSYFHLLLLLPYPTPFSLGCVHDECCLLPVLTKSQEGEEKDTTLQGWLAAHETEIRSLLNMSVSQPLTFATSK